MIENFKDKRISIILKLELELTEAILNEPNKNKFMKKSEQIEEIGTAISECLNKLYETKEPLSFNPFPKMYHPTDDSINIPFIVDGKKIIIEIKSSNYDY